METSFLDFSKFLAKLSACFTFQNLLHWYFFDLGISISINPKYEKCIFYSSKKSFYVWNCTHKIHERFIYFSPIKSIWIMCTSELRASWQLRTFELARKTVKSTLILSRHTHTIKPPNTHSYTYIQRFMNAHTCTLTRACWNYTFVFGKYPMFEK